LWQVTRGFSCVKKILAKVYNRYGGVVYENENYQNNWNGTYKGKNLADGTYYYVLEFTLINDKKVFFKGDVTILR
jgi:gliding motility-associated-like protein